MKLIVGLGNPGEEYAKTRHNVGWLVVNALASALGAGEWSHSEKFEAEMAEVGSGSDKVILLRPTTFMNNTGRAVERVRASYRIGDSTTHSGLRPLPRRQAGDSPRAERVPESQSTYEDIIVIHDELALPLGTMRISWGGSSAGHNGVGSVIHHLGTEQFWRVRLGIETKHPTRALDPTGYVLGVFNQQEQQRFNQALETWIPLLVDQLRSGTLSEHTRTLANS